MSSGGILGGKTPRETALAWLFVLVQLVLLVGSIVGGAGSAWSVAPWVRTLCRVLQYAGLGLLLVGAVNLGRSLTALPTPVPHGELRTGGLYRWMRHPIYTGVMALTLGGAVPSGNPTRLSCALGLVVLFMLKARWEEARLREQYPGYADYAAGASAVRAGRPAPVEHAFDRQLMSGHDGGVDPSPPGGRATIMHADLDAFYASVEQRDNPDLRGKPVVVGTGVVLAASYEARVVGVRSGMNGAERRRQCPNAIIIPPRMKAYSAASKLVMACFDDVTPLVEPLWVDEAFLDVSGSQRLLGSPREIAQNLRARVAAEVGLPLSVGIATTKFLAKVASAAAKPDGLIEVPVGGELDFLHPRPVECLWGVGPVTSRKLREAGFATVGQIAALNRDTLSGLVGTGAGHHLHALAHNRDPRVVDTQRGRRSISAQRALGNRNDRTLAEIQAIVLGLVDRIAQRLRAKDWVTRTVTVRFRFADMTRATRSHTLATPTATTAALHEVADQLTVDLLGAEAPEDGRTELARRGLTLIGVAFSGLGPSDAVQLTLPGTADEPLALQADRQELDSAVDAVRERFGHDLVKSAALLGQGPALEMPRLPD